MRNPMYSVQQGYDIQETYRSLGCNKRIFTPHHNMANTSALNPEPTQYNQGRNSQENEMEDTEEQIRGPHAVHVQETLRYSKLSSGTYWY
jgi:hypothetical protein